MKVTCEECGKQFKGQHGLNVHKHYKHKPSSNVVKVEEDKDAKDKVIERLLNILWFSLTLDQKDRAIGSLELDEDS